MARLRILCTLALVSVAAYAQRQMTVAQLVDFIKSAVQQKNDALQVAEFVRKIKLTNRLDDATVENLQNLGAGPRTVSALRALTDSTALLGLHPLQNPRLLWFPRRVRTSSSGFSTISAKTLSTTQSLPNFLCTQVTRRYVDPSGKEDWIQQDVIQEHLSYVDGMRTIRSSW